MFRLVLENFLKSEEKNKNVLINSDLAGLRYNEVALCFEIGVSDRITTINKELKDKKIKFIDNYHDFIDILTSLKNFQYPMFVYLVEVKGSKTQKPEFLILTATEQMKQKTILSINSVYIPENSDIFDYIKELLFRDGCNYSYFPINEDNDFTPFINPLIFNVLLAKKNIESRNEAVFNTFPHKSKSGKVREITAPNEEIKVALQKLNTLLQFVYDSKNKDFQIAYKKGKSVKTGAEIHKDNKYLYNIDLHHFFPSCKKEIVAPYFKFLFAGSINPEKIEEEFMNAILIDDALFIGNPISGTIANAIISKPVFYLNNICKKYDMELSVYADDMSFSSNKFINKDFIVSIFNLAFSKYKLDSYFNLNDEKFFGFSGSRRKVTGVAINADNNVTVPRPYYRNLRVMIDHLEKGDQSINITKLRGKIAYATMLDETGKVYNYLNKKLATVKKYNLCSDEKLEEMKEKFN